MQNWQNHPISALPYRPYRALRAWIAKVLSKKLTFPELLEPHYRVLTLHTVYLCFGHQPPSTCAFINHISNCMLYYVTLLPTTRLNPHQPSASSPSLPPFCQLSLICACLLIPFQLLPCGLELVGFPSELVGLP